MNHLDELRLNVLALSGAVEQDLKFFASIRHYVERLKDLLTDRMAEMSQAEIQLLADKIEQFFKQWRPNGSGLYIPPRQTSDSDPTVRDIDRLAANLAALDESDFLALLPTDLLPSLKIEDNDVTGQRNPCVFIGHGHSKLWARVKIHLEDDLDLATVTYESEPRTGESIVPVLEKMLDQATFAVLLLTAEDDTADGARRARQNVIHEAGLFQGRLGFRRAVLLVQDGIEEFSNVAGLQYIHFNGDKVEQAFYELGRVLKREGQID